MKISLRNIVWALVVCLCSCTAFLSAQTANLNQGPAVCSTNTEACEQSKMAQPSASQSKAEATDHQYNVAACRNGWGSCDRSKLTAAEVIALAVADHAQNLSQCKSGLGKCDHSRLTPSEENEITAAVRQRNLYDCREGWTSCDPALLTAAEVKAVAIARSQRNLSDCRDG